MKHTNIFIATALLGLGLTVASCNEKSNNFYSPSTPEIETPEDIIAFPGAEGYGCHTTGGRGGKVYHVTNLNDNESKGSFRYAVKQTGARTIVFDVAGTIKLTTPLEITDGNLTIAGQSAPGSGICISGANVTISGNNIIIRYLRFRPGTDVKYNDPSNGKVMQFNGLKGTGISNVIIDHCSISWSQGECLTANNNKNVTIQWCLIAEPLSQVSKTDTVYGRIGSWGGENVSFHHNLVAHSCQLPRLNPGSRTQKREMVDVRNNVFYNWTLKSLNGAEGMKANIVDNYYKPGPGTELAPDSIQYCIAALGVRTTSACYNKDEVTGEPLLDQPNTWSPMLHVWGKYYIDGNVMDGNDQVTNDNWTKGVLAQTYNGANVDYTFTRETQDTIRVTAPFDPDSIMGNTARRAYELVLDYAGCSKVRDAVDERIVQETKDGVATYGNLVEYVGKGYIYAPKEVGGYPVLSATADEKSAIADTDGDGMPDVWEKAHGLNINADGDGKTVKLSVAGYTNLEVYLNSLVEETTNKQQ